MQQHPGNAHRRYEQMRGHAGGECVEGGVGRDKVTVPVDDHRRVRQVAVQDPFEGGANRFELGVVQAGLRVGRCESGHKEQFVALADRHLEGFGQPDDH
jgi:hypothetical protein